MTASADQPAPADPEPAAPGPRWLDQEEQRAWRALLHGMERLDAALDKDLLDHGMSLTEYEVLAVLSERSEPLRMSVLAESVVQSRSRLTHTANRLERRGLVARAECPEDRRGIMLNLTDAGFAALAEAAPAHVESVRLRLLDHMTREEFLHLGELMRRVNEAAAEDIGL